MTALAHCQCHHPPMPVAAIAQQPIRATFPSKFVVCPEPRRIPTRTWSSDRNRAAGWFGSTHISSYSPAGVLIGSHCRFDHQTGLPSWDFAQR